MVNLIQLIQLEILTLNSAYFNWMKHLTVLCFISDPIQYTVGPSYTSEFRAWIVNG